MARTRGSPPVPRSATLANGTVQGHAVAPETVQQFLDVMQNAKGPVLGYCRSATRSAILWQIAAQAQARG